MTGSRSSIFTLAVMVAVFIYSKIHKLEELLLVFVLTLLLAVAGFILYNQFKSEIIIQDRVTETIQGEKFEFSLTGIAKWSGRYDLWQHRFNTFKLEGNQLAILIGIGYTIPNEDYADNGFISTLLNNGIIGLLLKLLLFYIFLTKGFFRAIRHYRKNEIDSPYIVFAFGAFAILMWEMTADMTDHYKLGQLFFLFLSIALFINSIAIRPHSK
jgi:O-antigen ligase